MKTEIVFEILAEGGSLTIERQRSLTQEKFIYHHSEMDSSDEGLEVSKNGEYKSFEEAFQLINSKYQWFLLYLETVHADYQEYIREELIKKMNFIGIKPEDIQFSKKDLERSLNVTLEYDNLLSKSGLQHIKVKSLIELTEYENREYKEEHKGKYKQKAKLIGKYKMWTEEQTYIRENMEILTAKRDFETIGKLEVSGNTIIIKNEFGQIEKIFPSDKYFVSASPILSESLGWVCLWL